MHYLIYAVCVLAIVFLIIIFAAVIGFVSRVIGWFAFIDGPAEDQLKVAWLISTFIAALAGFILAIIF